MTEEKTDSVMEGLSVSDKVEFKHLRVELRKTSTSVVVNDPNLKKRIAKFFQRLLDYSDKGEITIQDAALIIAGFMEYDFGDDLDRVISIAGELELPQNQTADDGLGMIGELTELLHKYDSGMRPTSD